MYNKKQEKTDSCEKWGKKVKKMKKSCWHWERIILYIQSPADEVRLKKKLARLARL